MQCADRSPAHWTPARAIDLDEDLDVTSDQLVPDPAILFRRLARGPDDCRR